MDVKQIQRRQNSGADRQSTKDDPADPADPGFPGDLPLLYLVGSADLLDDYLHHHQLVADGLCLSFLHRKDQVGKRTQAAEQHG